MMIRKNKFHISKRLKKAKKKKRGLDIKNSNKTCFRIMAESL